MSNSFPWGYQFRKMQHMISVSSEHIACVYEKVYNEIATLYADLVNLPCNWMYVISNDIWLSKKHFFYGLPM